MPQGAPACRWLPMWTLGVAAAPAVQKIASHDLKRPDSHEPPNHAWPPLDFFPILFHNLIILLVVSLHFLYVSNGLSTWEFSAPQKQRFINSSTIDFSHNSLRAAYWARQMALRHANRRTDVTRSNIRRLATSPTSRHVGEGGIYNRRWWEDVCIVLRPALI